jgi:polyribonucleotide nucleotidyltransferase
MGIARVEAEIGGQNFSIEAGKIAKQANGSVVVRLGDTMILATAVVGDERDFNFLPLTVDYREMLPAGGKFPGGFMKREGRPSTKEILTCRLIDRPIRPLFPEGFHNELQVMIRTLSADFVNDPDILAMNGASAAMAISDIPFDGPIGCVRIGRVDGELVVNPTAEQMGQSDLELTVAGRMESLTMVEGGGDEISEDVIVEALELAHENIKTLVKLQEKLMKMCGKEKRDDFHLNEVPQEAVDAVFAYRSKLEEVFFTPGKKECGKALKAVRDAMIEEICDPEDADDSKPKIGDAKEGWYKLLGEVTRDFALQGRRSDNRDTTTIRPINVEVGLLPRSHGSALFTRGETQSIVFAALGTGRDEQIVDGLMPEYTEPFYLHYNFPSYSVGEARPSRGPGRREIGHGSLAQRALKPLVPDTEEFPYTVRILSEITESNGSSSMATVCGGSLAMMDAGVPIKRPVAGIAMGLITKDNDVAILSDILGSEDAHGDMDFKCAGTEDGVTAIQMDIKTKGLAISTMKDALQQAKDGRLHILGEMNKVISEAREELSPWAPRMELIKINPEKIGAVIGSGGSVIKKIQAETETTIEIEDSGDVLISSPALANVEKAIEWIRSLTEDLEVGRIYEATVVSIKDFGCFVATKPGGQEGLVHISELSNEYVNSVEDVVKMGDDVQVKVLSVDDQGRVRLSIRATQPGYEENQPVGAGAEGREGGGGRGGRGGGRGRSGGGGGGRGRRNDR